MQQAPLVLLARNPILLSQSELVEDLELGFYRLDVLIIDLALGIKDCIGATAAIGTSAVAHQNLVSRHFFLELLDFPVEVGQMITLVDALLLVNFL